MIDLLELNNLWKELPTMKRLNIISESYACMAEVAAGVETGRRAERERQQEAREMEHCREHMGDHAHEGKTWLSNKSEDVLCFMSEKIKNLLYKNTLKINECLLLSSVKTLIKFRNDNSI